MPRVPIICLANSRKYGGRCVAGLRTDGSGWLRPVSAAECGIFRPPDYTLADGSEAGLLDVIEVGLGTPRPAPHQPENWEYDGTAWKLLSRPLAPDLAPVLCRAVERDHRLLGSLSERAPVEDFRSKPATASLALVAPASLYLYHQLGYHGKPQARGRFWLGAGADTFLYDLGITDPQWEGRIIKQAAPVDLCQEKCKFVLTISLGEPLGLYCHKLIASIIPLPRAIATTLDS